MSEQQSTVDIQAPRQLVWDVLTDVQSWPEWMAEVKEVRTQTPAGGLGAEYSLSQGVPALGLPMTVRVAAFDVPERLVLEQSQAGSRTEVTYTLTSVDERTTRMHTVLSASGLTGAFNTVLGGTYTSMLEEGGTALKDRCEGRV